MKLLQKLLADTTGGSAIEYGFIATMIAVASLVGIQGLGAEVGNSFTDTANAVRDATP
jgi:pilus assembly protein Flp/PilA